MATDQTDEATRVLVPLDGSALAEQAIPYAQALAGEGELIFLQVVPEAQPIRGLLGDVITSVDDVRQMYEAAARTELEEIAERWRTVAPKTRIELATGDPAAAILGVADREGCATIVVASHGRGALGRWTFGSVADRLARTADMPVLIVRPHSAKDEVRSAEVRRLLVPYDGSELAAGALPVAAAVAKRLNVPIHVVRAIDPAAEIVPYPSLEAAYPANLMNEMTQHLELEARQSVDEAAKKLTEQGLAATTAVEFGSAAAVIEDALHEGDVIIMTSHGRTGVRRWVLGSIAEKLVRHGSAPVMLVPAAERGKV